jgi:hypothetical protein
VGNAEISTKLPGTPMGCRYGERENSAVELPRRRRRIGGKGELSFCRRRKKKKNSSFERVLQGLAVSIVQKLIESVT